MADSLDLFLQELENVESEKEARNPNKAKKEAEKKISSIIHAGDTDSSEDECNRDYQNSKYNEYGRNIKHLLTDDKVASDSSKSTNSPNWKRKPQAPAKTTPSDVITDPFFGIRITKPLISSALLRTKMEGRRAVTMSQVAKFLLIPNQTEDWVIAGVLVQKSPVKTSQKGSQYLVWTLSDLRDEILKSVSVLLFTSAQKKLWTTAVGTVVGVLNPSVMEQRDDSKMEATFMVNNPDRVMILGQSKDLGFCKSKKKNGEACTAFLNVNKGSFCIYHIQKEYNLMSRRSELQSSFGGHVALRNKVLGKNEVFYAGKSYTAIPAKRSKKLVQQDQNRLKALSHIDRSNTNIVVKATKANCAVSFDVNPVQRKKDLEMLKKLGVTKPERPESSPSTSGVGASESRKNALNLIAKLKNKSSLKVVDKTPKLSDPSDVSDKLNIEFTAKQIIKELQEEKKNVSAVNESFEPTPSTSKQNGLEKLVAEPIPSTSKVEITEDKPKQNGFKSVDKSMTDKIPKLSDPFSNSTKETIKECDNNDLNKENKSFESIPSTSKAEMILIESKPTLKSTSSFENIEKNRGNIGVNSCDLFDNEMDDAFSKLDYDFKNVDLKVVPKLSNPVKQKTAVKTYLERLNNDKSLIKTKVQPNKTNFKRNAAILGLVTNSKCKQGDAERTETEINLPKIDDKVTKNRNNKIINLLSSETTDNTPLSVKKTDTFPSPKNDSESISKKPKQTINLVSKVSKLQMNRAKLNALMWVQKNGPIPKQNPTGRKPASKRLLEDAEENQENKKQKTNEEIRKKFKEMIGVKSKHENLLELVENEEQEKYFQKLELREKMEDKMMNTYKIECKAVKCLVCKYTSFSAADKCKQDKHKLKVFDAFKRFFQCGNCGNRTVSLHVIPLFSCKNCNGSKWERTTMMKEKIVKIGEELSIRGGEQTFLGSTIGNSSLSLLVSEET